ncbi:hypothetical protein C8Q78DRAFT_1079298 [Trametes maxima]|nr:hypothetical protein C8Q78DRAFT_1079298 [Trametes maxima]
MAAILRSPTVLQVLLVLPPTNHPLRNPLIQYKYLYKRTYALAHSATIIVSNKSSSSITLFVSKFSNPTGSDRWYTLAPGRSDSWDRSGWELVAFKNSNDTHRAGVYIHTNQEVAFFNMDHIIVL